MLRLVSVNARIRARGFCGLSGFRLQSSIKASSGHRRSYSHWAMGAQSPLNSLADLKALVSTVGLEARADQLQYCAPMKVAPTYGLDEWGTILKEAYAETGPSVDWRAPRVTGLVLGTGFGKTHALLEAPAAWGGSPLPRQIYIAYNLEQRLYVDRTTPQAAFLIRVVLATMGFGNVASDDVLQFIGAERLSTLNYLFQFEEEVAMEVKTWLGNQRLVLAVDELMQLAPDVPGGSRSLTAVKGVLKALGRLSDHLRLENVECLALASSLHEDAFVWELPSNRGIRRVKLPSPSPRDLVEWVAHAQKCDANVEGLAALTGSHWRSAVTAIDCLMSGEVAGVPELWKELGPNSVRSMSIKHQYQVRDYILKEYSQDSLKAVCEHPDAQMFMNTDRSFPPALVRALFSKIGSSPICDFFTDNSDFLGIEATKQLAHYGVNFDRFKAEMRLPLLARGVLVHVPATSPRCSSWFSDLTLSECAAQRPCDQSWFAVRGTDGEVELCLQLDEISGFQIYHPTAKNHPWIDRAAVARSASNEKCIVLYRDKTDDSLEQALDDLSNAAGKIREKNPQIDILCVAQVLQDTTHPYDRLSFQFPLFVINKVTLRMWYRPTFAGAVECLAGAGTTGRAEKGTAKDRKSPTQGGAS